MIISKLPPLSKEYEHYLLISPDKLPLHLKRGWTVIATVMWDEDTTGKGVTANHKLLVAKDPVIPKVPKGPLPELRLPNDFPPGAECVPKHRKFDKILPDMIALIDELGGTDKLVSLIDRHKLRASFKAAFALPLVGVDVKALKENSPDGDVTTDDVVAAAKLQDSKPVEDKQAGEPKTWKEALASKLEGVKAAKADEQETKTEAASEATQVDAQ